MKTNTFEFLMMNNPLRRLIQEHYEIKKFLDIPDSIEGKKVLEIGCGNGFGTKLINKYFQPKKIIGIDLDEKMIDKAIKNRLKNADFQVGDATKLQIKSLSIDAVFDFGAIHHIPNWKDCLNEIYRVLKSGGQIFIEDLSIDTFNMPFGLFMRKLTHHPYKNMYKYSEFANHFEEVGFKIIKKEIYKPIGLPYFVIVGKK
jgi:ubiquinone/menaquinone biosynthesis C-methylase UbiE